MHITIESICKCYLVHVYYSHTNTYSGKRLVFDASSPHTQRHMFLVDGLWVRQGKWDTRSIREQHIYSVRMTPCLEQFLQLYAQNDDQRIYSIVKIKKSYTSQSGFTVCENGLHVLWKSCTLTERAVVEEKTFFSPKSLDFKYSLCCFFPAISHKMIERIFSGTVTR